MSAWVWAGVATLGGLGAIARFVIDALVAGRLGRGFPFGTLAINLSGAFLLGLLTGLAVKGNLLVLAGTATLGAFTTFSTWMFETHRLAERGEVSLAFANVVISLIAGVGVALLGRALGAQL